MKKHTKHLVLVVLAILMIGAVPQLAAAQKTNDIAIRTRLEANQKLYPFTLSEEEKLALSAKCFAVQEKLRVFQDTFRFNEETREGAYRRVESRISALQKRFDSQELDASVLDLLLANYRKDLAVHTNAVTQHEVIVGDAIAMDCANEPELFRSQIEAIRVAYQKVIEENVRIESILISGAPQALMSMKEKLAE